MLAMYNPSSFLFRKKSHPVSPSSKNPCKETNQATVKLLELIFLSFVSRIDWINGRFPTLNLSA